MRTKQELTMYQLRCELVGGNDPLLATTSLSSCDCHCFSRGATNVSSNGHRNVSIDTVCKNSDQSNQGLDNALLGVVSQGRENGGVKDTAMDSDWISSGYTSLQLQDETGESSDQKRKANGLREEVQIGNVSNGVQSIQVEPTCNGVTSARGLFELTHLSKVSQIPHSHDKKPHTNTRTNAMTKRGSNLQERVRAHIKFCSSGMS